MALDVPPGWHVYANPTGLDDVPPIAAHARAGQPLQQIERVAYPPGAARALASTGRGEGRRLRGQGPLLVSLPAGAGNPDAAPFVAPALTFTVAYQRATTASAWPGAAESDAGCTRMMGDAFGRSGPGRRRRTLAGLGGQLDLPVLEVDGGAAAEEVDEGDELVAFAAADHAALHAGQGPGQDRDAAPTGTIGSGTTTRPEPSIVWICRRSWPRAPWSATSRIRASRLPFSDARARAVAAEEQVAREERQDRPRLPPLGGAILVDHLGQVVGDPLGAEVARRRLLLAGPGVQAPPRRPSGPSPFGSFQRSGG